MKLVSFNLFGMLLGGLTALAADLGYTLEHAAKMKGVIEVVISPDGRQIAYTLGVPLDPIKGENGASWRELHVVNQQGQSRPILQTKSTLLSILRSFCELFIRIDIDKTPSFAIGLLVN